MIVQQRSGADLYEGPQSRGWGAVWARGEIQVRSRGLHSRVSKRRVRGGGSGGHRRVHQPWGGSEGRQQMQPLQEPWEVGSSQADSKGVQGRGRRSRGLLRMVAIRPKGGGGKAVGALRGEASRSTRME